MSRAKDVIARRREGAEGPTCSFCGRHTSDVVAGPGGAGAVCICRDCIVASHRAVHDDEGAT